MGAPPPQPRADPPEAELVPDLAAPVIAAGAVDSGAARVAARVVDAGPKDDGGPITLYVKADAVDRALASQGKNVRGRTARGPDGKPIGVRLTGVSQFGVGLQDGDLIVAIEGKPTMDDDTATDVVLSAIGQGKSVIHAKLVRGARPIDLTLEVPLDAAADAPKAGTGKAGGDAAAKVAGDGGARPIR